MAATKILVVRRMGCVTSLSTERWGNIKDIAGESRAVLIWQRMVAKLDKLNIAGAAAVTPVSYCVTALISSPPHQAPVALYVTHNNDNVVWTLYVMYCVCTRYTYHTYLYTCQYLDVSLYRWHVWRMPPYNVYTCPGMSRIHFINIPREIKVSTRDKLHMKVMRHLHTGPSACLPRAVIKDWKQRVIWHIENNREQVLSQEILVIGMVGVG